MRILKSLCVCWFLFTSSLLYANEETVITNFPIGELFTPIMADAKEPQFSVGVRRVRTNGPIKEMTAAIVSYGEHFGLRRWQTSKNKLWQISLGGAVHAQFNLDSDSNDLINADYTIGISNTHRNGRISWRHRIFHQSTHLGDEFLLSENNVERVNFSLEATDLMVSYEWPEWRVLAGVTYILHVEPHQFDDFGFQTGLEYHSVEHVFLKARLVSGFDFQTDNSGLTETNTNFKAGLEWGKRGSGNRRIRLMLTLYDGVVPFGQFYSVKTSAVGISVYLGF